LAEAKADLPVLFFEDEAAWKKWLDENHADPSGVWLKFAKKGSGIASLNYSGALDEALCYGWIDGQSKSIDEIYYLQKFTPRREKSIWSKRNIEKIAELIAAGKMHASGVVAIEAAKADGRWERAYDSSANSTISPDLQAEFDKHPKAQAFYETLNKTNKYAFLWRIQTAKRAETRARHIARTMEMLEAGKTYH
jgi:uncharacterized protein YdeI (YjbR/CyaY-like superfamily)